MTEVGRVNFGPTASPSSVPSRHGMQAEKRRPPLVDGTAPVPPVMLSQLEPGSQVVPCCSLDITIQASIAISLKRIADSLESDTVSGPLDVVLHPEWKDDLSQRQYRDELRKEVKR